MQNTSGQCLFEFTWNCAGRNSVSDIVAYRLDDAPPGECEAGSLSNNDGIELRPHVVSEPEDPAPCELTVTVKPSSQLTAIDVLCNARHIETFSSSGEYVSTSDGVRVDDEIGCGRSVYMIPCSFEYPVSFGKLRFVSLETPSALWIHSIHATICPATFPNGNPSMTLPQFPFAALGLPSSGPKIDLAKVRSILAEIGGEELSSSAKDLMSRVEMKQKELEATVSRSLPPSFAQMMSMFGNLSTASFNAPQNTNRTVSSLATLQQPTDGSVRVPSPPMGGDLKLSPGGPVSQPVAASIREEDATCTVAGAVETAASSYDSQCEKCRVKCPVTPVAMDIERLVAKTVGDAEQRLARQIGELETRLNEKLDRILTIVSGIQGIETLTLPPPEAQDGSTSVDLTDAQEI